MAGRSGAFCCMWCATSSPIRPQPAWGLKNHLTSPVGGFAGDFMRFCFLARNVRGQASPKDNPSALHRQVIEFDEKENKCQCQAPRKTAFDALDKDKLSTAEVGRPKLGAAYVIPRADATTPHALATSFHAEILFSPKLQGGKPRQSYRLPADMDASERKFASGKWESAGPEQHDRG